MKNRPGEKIKLMTVDQLLKVPEGELSEQIPVDDIREFANHPFKVLNDDKMRELIESILANGILTPVIVRVCDDGKYEMISGHRRLFAARAIGLDTIPAIVKEMNDDQATIAMVDSNLQREKILHSEKAFAYKMRYQAMRHQGKRAVVDPGDIDMPLYGQRTSSQLGTKLRADEELALQVGESRNQVHRYLRLTELIPELLDLIDKDRIAIMTGVDISYLKADVQKWIYQYVKENGVVKSYQVTALRQYIENVDHYTQSEVISVLNENLPGRLPSHRVAFSGKQLKKYFPAYYTADEMEKVIVSLLEKWKHEQEKNGGF